MRWVASVIFNHDRSSMKIEAIRMILPKSNKTSVSDTFPYQLCSSLLTSERHDFYRVLIEAMDTGTVIQAFVPVKNLLVPNRTGGKPAYMRPERRIEKLFFDFVLFDELSMRPLLAIDLVEKNRGLSQPDRQKYNLAEGVGLPVLSVTAQSQYSTDLISESINALISH